MGIRFNLRDEQADFEFVRSLQHDAVAIDDTGRTVGYQAVGSTGEISANHRHPFR